MNPNTHTTTEAISARLIELHNIRFDPTARWTALLQMEYERLIARRDALTRGQSRPVAN